ncbi:unnamed protein product [Paramecium pentaurelia]|uniref:Uncharacterized protein n=1 Tax=Paramecium pentaurelia TaxID=43138 RepID=A0A8S1SG10_9CILI|nr:unnamed protein product [Paramecium pentaurelia]
MISIVPILQKFIQEGQQYFKAYNDLEKNKNELAQVISEVTILLSEIQYFERYEGFYNYDEKQLIQQCKDKLHLSDTVLKQSPSKVNIILDYFYITGNNYKELIDCQNVLNGYKIQIDELLRKSQEIFVTVINPINQQPQNSYIYNLQIKLKLKAPRSIKSIFDKYPYHLKNAYLFQFSMGDSCASKVDVHVFKRDEFTQLYAIEKQFKTYTISRRNHCTLQMRNQLQFSPQKKVCSNSQMETPTPEDYSIIIPQKDFNSLSNKFKLYLIVNGQNGMKIIRNSKEILHIRSGQECELQEDDQIVFFQDCNENPQVSYIVQQILIKQEQ